MLVNNYMYVHLTLFCVLGLFFPSSRYIFTSENYTTNNNWRVWWKKGVRSFTQKWTLSTFVVNRSKLHMQFCLGAFNNVLYVFLLKFASFSKYSIMHAKHLYLLSRQHVTANSVISLKIQQNIDLSQRVSLKNVDFRLKPLKLGFHVN